MVVRGVQCLLGMGLLTQSLAREAWLCAETAVDTKVQQVGAPCVWPSESILMDATCTEHSVSQKKEIWMTRRSQP